MANGDENETRVTVERDGHVLLIGLNRPEKRNAADWRMLQQLSLAYGELDRDPDLRAGLVFAHGEHFTAGLDLADVSAAHRTRRPRPAFRRAASTRGRHRTGIRFRSRW